MNRTTVDESTDEVPAVDPGAGPAPEGPDPASTGPAGPADDADVVEADPTVLEEEDPRTLHRVSWATTSGAFLIAVVILLARGDYGYAGVTFAVALAAAVNLT